MQPRHHNPILLDVYCAKLSRESPITLDKISFPRAEVKIEAKMTLDTIFVK